MHVEADIQMLDKMSILSVAENTSLSKWPSMSMRLKRTETP